MKPTVTRRELDDPKATRQEIKIRLGERGFQASVVRLRKTSRSKWDKPYLDFSDLRYQPVETVDDVISVLILAARIARAWDAGEPLPEEVE